MSDNYSRLPTPQRTEVPGLVPFRDQSRGDFLYAAELGYYDEPPSEQFDFRNAFGVLWSRKWMIIATALIGVAIAFVLTLRVVPLYTSYVTIEIQKQEFQVIEGTSIGPEVVADSAYLATQNRLIRSRSLAERVAEELGLPNDPRYASPDAPREQRLRQATRMVQNGIRVSPVGNSRLVAISFISSYPQETARIANAIAEVHIQSNLERKFNTTAFAREFLDERLATTKRLLEDSERNFTKYAAEQGLIDIGGVTSGAGSLEENSIISLNGELSVAESERIRAEQEYLIASGVEPEYELLQSNTLIALRQNQSALISEYQDMLTRFKPDYPDMVSLQSRIDRIEEEIRRESANIVQSDLNELKVAYDAAVAREASLRTRVDELRDVLQEDRNRRIQYQILQREVETVRTQYEALLQRSKEVSIASGVGSSNISIVDYAMVPGRPFSPNIPRSLLQALVLSLALGVGLAFAINFFDDTIRTPEDVRSKLGLPAIGVVPKISKKKDIVTEVTEQPKSSIAEAFTAAQTALEFSTAEGMPSSLLITSTRPGEGKTSTAVSLAMAFARVGKQVLIVDADMRKPSFVVDSNNSIGLSGLLTSHEKLSDHAVRSSTAGLSILPAGVVPPDPAQLLSGARLREILTDAKADYDIVIVDSPPVLNFADGPRLGSIVDGALLVVQSGLIRTPAARRTMMQLSDARTNILGCMLTKFDVKSYGHEYGYYYAPYGDKAKSYITADTKRDSKRKILINAAEDETRPDEIERWG